MSKFDRGIVMLCSIKEYDLALHQRVVPKSSGIHSTFIEDFLTDQERRKHLSHSLFLSLLISFYLFLSLLISFYIFLSLSISFYLPLSFSHSLFLSLTLSFYLSRSLFLSLNLFLDSFSFLQNFSFFVETFCECLVCCCRDL